MMENMSSLSLYYIGLQLFLFLLAFKMALSIGLIFYCGHIKNRDIKAAREKEDYDKEKIMKRQKSIGRLANIERYTVIKGRVHG